MGFALMHALRNGFGRMETSQNLNHKLIQVGTKRQVIRHEELGSISKGDKNK